MLVRGLSQMARLAARYTGGNDYYAFVGADNRSNRKRSKEMVALAAFSGAARRICQTRVNNDDGCVFVTSSEVA